MVYIIDAKVISKEMFSRKTWCWVEGMGYQLAQKCAYGHGPFGANFHEVTISFFLNPYVTPAHPCPRRRRNYPRHNRDE